MPKTQLLNVQLRILLMSQHDFREKKEEEEKKKQNLGQKWFDQITEA